jgi:hypothetical protein
VQGHTSDRAKGVVAFTPPGIQQGHTRDTTPGAAASCLMLRDTWVQGYQAERGGELRHETAKHSRAGRTWH